MLDPGRWSVKCVCRALRADPNQPPSLADKGADRPYEGRSFPRLSENDATPEQCPRPKIGRIRVARSGFEPLISALRGLHPRPLDERAGE